MNCHLSNFLSIDKFSAENWLKHNFEASFQNFQDLQVSHSLVISKKISEPNYALAKKILALEEAQKTLIPVAEKISALIAEKNIFQQWIMNLCYFLHQWGWKQYSTLEAHQRVESSIQQVIKSIELLKSSIKIPFDETEVSKYKQNYEDQLKSNQIETFLTDFSNFVFENVKMPEGEDFEKFEGRSAVLAIINLKKSLAEFNQKHPDNDSILDVFNQLKWMIDFFIKVNHFSNGKLTQESLSLAYQRFYENLANSSLSIMTVKESHQVHPQIFSDILVGEIKDKVSRLNEQTKSMMFYGGVTGKDVSGHSIIHRIQKDLDETYSFIVFNTGQGVVGNHEIEDVNGVSYVYPLVISGLSFSHVTNAKFLKAIISKQVIPTNRVERAIKEIYQAINKYLVVEGNGIQQLRLGIWYPMQIKGTCSYSSTNMGLAQDLSFQHLHEFKKLSAITMLKQFNKIQKASQKVSKDLQKKLKMMERLRDLLASHYGIETT